MPHYFFKKTAHACLLSLLLFACHAAHARLKVGDAAPVLHINTVSGQALHFNASRGRVLVLSFWATWCPPCLKEMPELNRLYQRYHAHGLDVVGISVDAPEDAAAVRAFIKTTQYPIALKAQSNAAAFGRVWAVPLLFIVDKNGVLQADGWPGFNEKDFPALEKKIQALLAAEQKK